MQSPYAPDGKHIVPVAARPAVITLIAHLGDAGGVGTGYKIFASSQVAAGSADFWLMAHAGDAGAGGAVSNFHRTCAHESAELYCYCPRRRCRRQRRQIKCMLAQSAREARNKFDCPRKRCRCRRRQEQKCIVPVGVAEIFVDCTRRRRSYGAAGAMNKQEY